MDHIEKTFFIIFTILCGLLFALLQLSNSALFTREYSFDTLTTLDASFQTESPQIPFIIDIDEFSVDWYAQYPISRRLFARVVDNLHTAGVKTIVFNFIFYTPWAIPEEDKIFANSVRLAGNVIMASEFVEEETALGKFEWIREPLFMDSASAIGFTNFNMDRDGKVRKANRTHTITAFSRAVKKLQSLAYTTYIKYRDGNIFENIPDSIYLQYPLKPIQTISFSEAERGEIFRNNPSQFANRIAIIGSSFQGTYVTSGSILRPGAEIIATELNNYLNHSWIIEKRPLLVIITDLLLIFLLGTVIYNFNILVNLLFIPLSLGYLLLCALSYLHFKHIFYPVIADMILLSLISLLLIIYKVIVYERNRSDLLRINDKRQQSIGQMETLANLASEVIHDIGSPVAAISTDCNIIKKYAETNPAALLTSEVFVRIDRNVSRIISVISRIKYLRQSKPEARKHCSIRTIIGEAVELSKQLTRKKDAIVQIDLNHHSDIIVGNENELTIAIANIITNGIQANLQNPVIRIQSNSRSKISRALFGSKYIIEIAIQDNGCGIPRDKLKNIFEPYFTTKTDGTGLGLFTAQKTIIEHGGSITVRSETGKGARFAIILPIKEVPIE